jgi:hypothetical protein
MPSPPPTDLDALLEALDVADAAVRALYLKLADNPDLAPEYGPGLRELQRKRVELAQQVGVAALAQWREARDAGETSLETNGAEEQPASLPSEPEPEPAVTRLGVPLPVETPALVPTPPASESPVDVPQLGPQVVTYRTARDRRWARGSQGSASPWDRLWASYPHKRGPDTAEQSGPPVDDNKSAKSDLHNPGGTSNRDKNDDTVEQTDAPKVSDPSIATWQIATVGVVVAVVVACLGVLIFQSHDFSTTLPIQIGTSVRTDARHRGHCVGGASC